MVRRQRKYEKPMDDTGRGTELDYLYPNGDPRKEAVARIDETTIEYKNLTRAITECIQENPNRYRDNELYDPPAAWIRDVHFELVEMLGVHDWNRVKVVPALKTAADKYYGIDFFIIYTDPTTEKDIIVTVDITVRKKKEQHKADVVVSDTWVSANKEFYPQISRIEIPDVYAASAEEEKMLNKERRRAVAYSITDIIRAKKAEGDEHYPIIETRMQLSELFEAEEAA